MAGSCPTPRRQHWWSRVWRLYADGFRSMTVGRTLWAIIAIKVVVFFVILRWIFFPDFLASKASDDAGKAAYVRQELLSSPTSNAPDTPPAKRDDSATAEQREGNATKTNNKTK